MGCRDSEMEDEDEDEISDMEEEEDEVEDSGEELGARGGTQASNRRGKRGKTAASSLKVTLARERCQADLPSFLAYQQVPVQNRHWLPCLRECPDSVLA